MNKVTLVSLSASLLVLITNGFAQKAPAIKKLNPAKLERLVTQGGNRLAHRVPGVYIPAKTTIVALERQIAYVAQQANIKLNEKEIHTIAHNPQRLLQFQKKAGIPLFENHTLTYKEGLKVLKANQEKFAAARANSEYETKWELFQAGHDIDYIESFPDFYTSPKEIAEEVYNFYKFYNIPFENLPHVQEISETGSEGVLLEIPVDGLSYLRPPLKKENVNVSAEKFVVIHYNDGTSALVPRALLEAKENRQPIAFRVIK